MGAPLLLLTVHLCVCAVLRLVLSVVWLETEVGSGGGGTLEGMVLGCLVRTVPFSEARMVKRWCLMWGSRCVHLCDLVAVRQMIRLLLRWVRRRALLRLREMLVRTGSISWTCGLWLRQSAFVSSVWTLTEHSALEGLAVI